MKALSRQEKKAFRSLKRRFTLGAIIAAIVAIVGGGAAYFRRNAIRDTEDRMFLEAEVARLIANGANVNDADQYGRTVLIRAAHSGHENIVKQLIEAGADVNAADQNEWTALMMAVDMGHENVVEKLLQEEGIEVNAQNSEGWTALMIAAYRTNHKIAELLLLKGADRTIQNERKKTAENIARAYKHNAIANMIRDFILPPAGRTVKSAGKKGKEEENK